MTIDEAGLLNHNAFFGKFIGDSKSLVVLEIDSKLQILWNNTNFLQCTGLENKPVGKNLKSFLLKESTSSLPLKDGIGTLIVPLNFSSSSSSSIKICCHIFRTENNGYLIIGESLTISYDDILKKMTLMSNEIANMARDLRRKNRDLQDAYDKIKTLSGIVPICMHCKEIRDDKGYWNNLEQFISNHSEATFSHGICEKCVEKYYGEDMAETEKDEKEKL